MDRVQRKPTPESLFEARLFCEVGELLLWRSHEHFAGRYIAESATPPVELDLRPIDGWSKFSGVVEMIPNSPFVRRVTKGGSITVTPPGVGVKIHSYVCENVETGCVRVAATRFISIIASEDDNA